MLAAADLAAAQFSKAPVLSPDRTFQIQLTVLPPPVDPGPPPDDLLPINYYAAQGDWFYIGMGNWGFCAADLGNGRAFAVLAPSLAARPALVARCLLNTLLTNYLMRSGYAMLHATGLVRGDRVLLLMAPHNSGKSTTALRLALSGRFRLLTDSMIYISIVEGAVQLTGFPVGRGKLRLDMLPEFPGLQGLLSPEQVRDETKFVLDLRTLDPGLVEEGAFYPSEVDLCLLQRNEAEESALRPANLETVWKAVMLNSLHKDEPAVWEQNLGRIKPLVEMARHHHLEIGRDADGILAVVETLYSG